MTYGCNTFTSVLGYFGQQRNADNTTINSHKAPKVKQLALRLATNRLWFAGNKYLVSPYGVMNGRKDGGVDDGEDEDDDEDGSLRGRRASESASLCRRAEEEKAKGATVQADAWSRDTEHQPRRQVECCRRPAGNW